MDEDYAEHLMRPRSRSLNGIQVVLWDPSLWPVPGVQGSNKRRRDLDEDTSSYTSQSPIRQASTGPGPEQLFLSSPVSPSSTAPVADPAHDAYTDPSSSIRNLIRQPSLELPHSLYESAQISHGEADQGKRDQHHFAESVNTANPPHPPSTPSVYANFPDPDWEENRLSSTKSTLQEAADRRDSQLRSAKKAKAKLGGSFESIRRALAEIGGYPRVPPPSRADIASHAADLIRMESEETDLMEIRIKKLDAQIAQLESERLEADAAAEQYSNVTTLNADRGV
ncbi:hypothetical protein SISNIDRAFT_482942 [Sistotremastrum niveocremeum HHB9708]|uniref:Uncharacterized protein n=1 Tax=Sistotremastrum niveocremeum HHB9708 TaxID=1314777 RepID=A0A164XWR7_9AGAM|nr:hypothetical protein SISNIDRAFT_482942 [Sistotremastrum niveocremeum HHB9708]